MKQHEHAGRRADDPGDQILAHRASLAQDPPDDPDDQERQRHRPAVAQQRRRRDSHDSLSERHEIVGGDDGRDRAEHQPIDEQRGRRNDGQALAERLADAAGKTAGDEQRAGFDVGRADDDAEEHHC